MVTVSGATAPSRRDTDTAPQPRTTRPVKFWALIGCAIWVLQIYILWKWVTGPYFTPVPSGPVQPPLVMKVSIVIYLVVQWAAFGWLAIRWVIAPWLRDRRIGFDGLLFIAWAGFFWFWDPMGNMNGITFTYNAWIPNMGSWVNEIPGWSTPGSPGAQSPEPWLFTAGAYSVFFVAMPILGCFVMRKVSQLRPRTGKIAQLLIVYALVFVLETLLEGFFWMRMGLYTYAASPPQFVLFSDRYYRYPMIESLFWGAALTAITYLRSTRNDRGESLAERGVSSLRITEGAKTGLRLMAIVGMSYTLILAAFWVPYWLVWSAHTQGIPLDIQKRSYLMNGLCGPQTHIACPDPNVPAFRPHSITITPDGKIHVPPGSELPNGPTTFDQAAKLAEEKK
jgi:hypothetical protein